MTDIIFFRSPRTRFFLFLFLSFMTGIIILCPGLNFQLDLAPGDHGRDLYSFKKTYEGAVPYRDYSSQNGPLMPYYYSIFYHFFGVSIQTTLLGYYLLAFLSGMFVFLACAVFLKPSTSFLCALWYWALRLKFGNFFYTYNHIGAILSILVMVYCLFKYINGRKKAFFLGGNIAIVAATLVRPDIGVAGLAAFYAALLALHVIEGKITASALFRRWAPWFFASVGGAVFLYWLFVRLAPASVTSRDLAYWKFIMPENIVKNIFWFADTIVALFRGSRVGQAFAILVWLMAVKTFFYLATDIKNDPHKKRLALVIGSLILLTILVLLEYLLGFRWFRWMWIFAPSMILFFFFIETGLETTWGPLKRLALLFLLLAGILAAYKNHLFIQANKTPESHLKINGNDIYVEAYQKENIKTIAQASAYLIKNVPPGEKIAAIPYDALYYFLSGHDSVLRDMWFFQGPRNVRLLEERKVNYIVLSNRATHDIEAKGAVFGKNYGVGLARYLDENFDHVATFGPWGKPFDWLLNHAVKIYKRKTGRGHHPEG